MCDRLLLGLDLGTTRIKAALIDARAEVVGLAAVATPVRSDGDRREIEIEPLLGAVRAAVGRLSADLDLGAVEGIGLAGMAESGVALDGHGRPTSPVIVWSDRRGQEVVDALTQAFGDDLARSIGQRLRTVCSVVKLGWLSARPACPPITRWLGVPELVLHSLTGSAATEHSLAARTGCYHVGERRWMPDVAAAAGFDIDVFPPVLAAGTVMGRVAAHGASGLRPGTPVTIAGHDHLVGMVGAGVGGLDHANSVGTAESVVARRDSAPDPDTALAARVAVSLFPGGEAWALLAGALRAGVVVDAAARALGRTPAELDELATAVAGAGDPPEEAAMAAMVADLSAGREATLPGGLAGLVWAGVLAALAEETAKAARRMATVCGPPGRVVAFGGGSRSAPWMQAKAWSLAVPLWRSEVADAVVRGAAVFAGVAAGWWPSPPGAPQPRLIEIHRR